MYRFFTTPFHILFFVNNIMPTSFVCVLHGHIVKVVILLKIVLYNTEELARRSQAPPGIKNIYHVMPVFQIDDSADFAHLSHRYISASVQPESLQQQYPTRAHLPDLLAEVSFLTMMSSSLAEDIIDVDLLHLVEIQDFRYTKLSPPASSLYLIQIAKSGASRVYLIQSLTQYCSRTPVLKISTPPSMAT